MDQVLWYRRRVLDQHVSLAVLSPGMYGEDVLVVELLKQAPPHW
jgi:hypothetical protein